MTTLTNPCSLTKIPNKSTLYDHQYQGRIQDFFSRGCTRLLLYFNTNNPHFFFSEYQLY